MIRKSVNPTAYGPGDDIGVTFQDETTERLQNVHLEGVGTLKKQYAKLASDASDAEATYIATVTEAGKRRDAALGVLADRRDKLDADAFALAEKKLDQERAIEAAHTETQAKEASAAKQAVGGG